MSAQARPFSNSRLSIVLVPLTAYFYPLVVQRDRYRHCHRRRPQCRDKQPYVATSVLLIAFDPFQINPFPAPASSTITLIVSSTRAGLVGWGHVSQCQVIFSPHQSVGLLNGPTTNDIFGCLRRKRRTSESQSYKSREAAFATVIQSNISRCSEVTKLPLSFEVPRQNLS
jgi:hypothetical protein